MEWVVNLQEKTVGKKQSYKGKSIVCFLDLLGFSSVILKEWDNPIQNPLDTILALKRIITDVENSNGLVFNIKEEKESKKVNYTCNTRSISDSIIITVPIAGDLTIADVFFSILGLINSIARFWGMCLETGYTIRGGIDFGDIYWDENEIIGPAFINAYSIESNVAKTSRIVCSDQFVLLVLDICKNCK